MKQVSYRINLSEKLDKLLRNKANYVGVPVVAYIKQLILKDVEEQEYRISRKSQKQIDEALANFDRAVDSDEFFNQLNAKS